MIDYTQTDPERLQEIIWIQRSMIEMQAETIKRYQLAEVSSL